jgi:hypothetical protein
MAQPIPVNRPQRFAVLGDELCREIDRRDNSNLLAEYRPNGDLETVPGAWHAKTRTLCDERREQRVAAKVIPDG